MSGPMLSKPARQADLVQPGHISVILFIVLHSAACFGKVFGHVPARKPAEGMTRYHTRRGMVCRHFSDLQDGASPKTFAITYSQDMTDITHNRLSRKCHDSRRSRLCRHMPLSAGQGS